MKQASSYLILLTGIVLLTGCETTKYAYDQTLGDQREVGVFQTKTKDHSSDLLLANADDWVKEHLW